jgi:hypothetical protein
VLLHLTALEAVDPFVELLLQEAEGLGHRVVGVFELAFEAGLGVRVDLVSRERDFRADLEVPSVTMVGGRGGNEDAAALDPVVVLVELFGVLARCGLQRFRVLESLRMELKGLRHGFLLVGTAKNRA